MQRYVAFPLLVSLIALVGTVQSAGAQAPSVAGMRPVLDRLYRALARSDTAALREQLADDLVWTDGVSGIEATKAQVLAPRGSPVARWRGLPNTLARSRRFCQAA